MDFTNRVPSIHEDSFIANGAKVIGRVILKKGVSIWYNAVLRGDINDITIGENTNIQDNTVIHVADNYSTVVGNNVTVGHSVVIHACRIGDNCLIGMGSIIMDGSVISDNSIIAAGSIIPMGKTFEPNSLIMGSPAIVKRSLSDKEISGISNMADKYRKTWIAYVNGGIPCYDGKRDLPTL